MSLFNSLTMELLRVMQFKGAEIQVLLPLIRAQKVAIDAMEDAADINCALDVS